MTLKKWVLGGGCLEIFLIVRVGREKENLENLILINLLEKKKHSLLVNEIFDP